MGQSMELTVEGVELPAPVQGLIQESALDECVLSIPTPNCPLGWLLPGNNVSLRYCNAHGLHLAKATILDMRPGPPMELTLGEFREEETTQRRSYFRVGVTLPVALTVMTSRRSEPGTMDKGAITYDLGAGGLRLDTAVELDVEDRVWVALTVPQRLQKSHAPSLQTRAEVLRNEAIVRGGFDLWRVALKFIFRRDIDQDAWVHLALDLQRGVEE